MFGLAIHRRLARFVGAAPLAFGAILLPVAATAQSVVLAGTAPTYVKTALDNLAVAYTEELTMWATPDSADVLIMSNDGGTDTPVDYSTHLANGRHVLMIGGSNWGPMYTWIDGHFTRDASTGWHQSSDCTTDWTTDGSHPITQFMPATYEFANQSTSYHMVHFAVSQPVGTVLLGHTCHGAPDHFVAATRTYAGGGTMTYLALDLGPYDGGTTIADFTETFLTGYLSALSCGDGGLDAGEQCDDGNTENGDCCSSTCQYEAANAPCDDGEVCTDSDACDGAGTCSGPPLDCDDNDACTQDSCMPGDGCQNDATPASGCLAAGKSILLLRDAGDDAKDKLVWKWLKGAATMPTDFGSPTSSTNHTVCLYSGGASASIRLPGGGGWQATATGFKYGAASGLPDGAQKGLLKAGAAAKSKALVKGKGANLPDTLTPALPLPVVAQLVNDTTAVCLEATFTTAIKNSAGQFKAKAP